MKGHKTVTFEPLGLRVITPAGETILGAAGESIRIRSECGGKGTCGKCKVTVNNMESTGEITDAERKLLTQTEAASGYRLACQAKILEDIIVMIPLHSRLETSRIQTMGLEKRVRLDPVVRKFHHHLSKPTLMNNTADLQRLLIAMGKKSYEVEVDLEILRSLPEVLRAEDGGVTVVLLADDMIVAVEPGDTTGETFGFAVDLGTSKIVGHLVDLKTGETIAVGSIENPQMVYGEDIIVRITHALESGKNLSNLQSLAAEGFNLALRSACEKAHVDTARVYEATVVGNTAMHHLFLGLQPRYLTLSPYTPVTKSSFRVPASKLNLEMNQAGIVAFLPVVAGFVGSDAIASLLATGIHHSKSLSMLIDIGTNTEVLLGDSEQVLACSCASGPALEGGHIRHGMRAVEGAIERIRLDQNNNVEYETIGGGKPLGLCGSAVIDIVSEMFKNDIINRYGRFSLEKETDRMRREEVNEFIVAWRDETAIGEEITVTERDINEILLAKAAIYTASKILMKNRQVESTAIARLNISGAFGFYINPENAKTIGLLPEIPTEKIRFVGNTAVIGAKLALISKDMRNEAKMLASKIKYIELSNDPHFNIEYSKALAIR